MLYKFGGLRQKPPVGSVINWGLAICKDLKLYIPCNEGSGGQLHNAVNGNNFVFQDSVQVEQGDYVWGENTGGVYTYNNSASDAALRSFQFPAGPFYNISNGITYGGYAIFDNSTGNFPYLIGRRKPTDGGTFDWLVTAGTGGNWQAFMQVSGSGTVNTTAAPASTTLPELIIVTQDGSNLKMYVNGVLAATVAATGTANNDPNSVISIGNGTAATGSPVRYMKPIYALYMWNRVLDVTEIRNLADNPYSLCYCPKKYLFAAATTVPLTTSVADQINTMVDAQANSGTIKGALAFSDVMTLLDGLAIFGGAPDFQIAFGDNLLHLQDQLQSLAPVILKSFSDTLNNLSDSADKVLGIPVQAFDSANNWLDAVSQMLAGYLEKTASDTMNNLADSASVTSLNVPFLISVSDTLNNLQDAIRLWNVLRVLSGDQMVFSDALQARMNHLLRLSEVLSTFLENLGIAVVSKPTFADQLVLSDAISFAMAAEVTASASDQLSMSDAIVIDNQGNYNPASIIARIRRYLNDPQ